MVTVSGPRVTSSSQHGGESIVFGLLLFIAARQAALFTVAAIVLLALYNIFLSFFFLSYQVSGGRIANAVCDAVSVLRVVRSLNMNTSMEE